MTKATGRTRQERHLKRIDHAQELPEEPPVEREALEPHEWTVYLTLEPTDRVVHRLVLDEQGGVVDFAMMQETLDGGVWRQVIRYDCEPGHGAVHCHRFRTGRWEPIIEKRVADLAKLEEGYALATAGIYDSWAETARTSKEAGGVELGHLEVARTLTRRILRDRDFRESIAVGADGTRQIFTGALTDPMGAVFDLLEREPGPLTLAVKLGEGMAYLTMSTIPHEDDQDDLPIHPDANIGMFLIAVLQNDGRAVFHQADANIDLELELV